MSRGYRLLIVAAFVGLTTWAFIIGYNLAALNYPQQDRYDSYRDTASNVERIDPPLPRQANAESIKYRQPCQEPNGKDESDLCAQWKAARAAETGALWTERTFWLGVWGILVTTVGTALLLRSIAQSDEAIVQARHANEIAKSEIRPWLKFSASAKANVFPPSEGDGVFFASSPGGLEILIDIEVENIGSSACSYQVSIFPIIDQMFSDKTNNRSASFGGAVMPNDKIPHKGRDIFISFDSTPIYVITGFYEKTMESIHPRFTIHCKYFWDGKEGETTKFFTLSEYTDSVAVDIEMARRNIPLVLFTDDGGVIK